MKTTQILIIVSLSCLFISLGSFLIPKIPGVIKSVFLLIAVILLATSQVIKCKSKEFIDSSSKMEKDFTRIYEKNEWGSPDEQDGGPSDLYSGEGASATRCASYLTYVNSMLENTPKGKVVELGCGDLRLTSKMDMDNLTQYTCVDVVPEIVKRANVKFNSMPQCRGNNGERKCTAIIADGSRSLPHGDTLIAKDVLMHWPTETIHSFTSNVLPNFKTALITHNTRQTRGERPKISPGEFAGVHLVDMKIPKTHKVTEIMSDVCQEVDGTDLSGGSKKTWFVEQYSTLENTWSKPILNKKFTVVFDDGPWTIEENPIQKDSSLEDRSSMYHFLILQVLKSLPTNSTTRYIFAINGIYAYKYRNIIKLINDANITIANHSMMHFNYKKHSLQECINDWEECQRVLTDINGSPPTIFQYPYLSENKEFSIYLNKKGIEILSTDSKEAAIVDDWKDIDRQTLLLNIHNSIRKKKIKIIVLHSCKNTANNIYSILNIIESLGTLPI